MVSNMHQRACSLPGPGQATTATSAAESGSALVLTAPLQPGGPPVPLRRGGAALLRCQGRRTAARLA
jgi:hypothetical protein